MKVEITRNLLREIKAGKTAIDIADTKLPGFCIRVMPSGAIRYSIRYTDAYGKQVRHSLKKSFPAVNVSDARELARIELGKVAAGDSPAAERKAISKGKISLFDFIDRHYEPYLKSKSKNHAATVSRIKKSFAAFKDTPLIQIDALSIEQWRAGKIAAGLSPVTVNRDVGALRPLFSRAVEWKILAEHPLKSVKALKSTADPIIRYLSDAEELRLRAALDHREVRGRDARTRANAWRAARRYNLLPELDGTLFIDYLTPAVLLSINTGLRQGELIQMQWGDVDLDRRLLTIRGEYAKSGKTRHVPLNDEALSVLTQWKRQQGDSSLVFPSRDDKPIAEVKTAWRKLLADAEINQFRWHDMRHHFASRLVMAGVDLNTVRELLGHADLKMTLRYAHLAPEHKVAAVQKLVRIPLGTAGTKKVTK
jgi:integrase